MTRPVSLLPDAELAVIAYLRGRSEITAILPAARITTALPSVPAWPALLVQRSGGRPVAAERLDAADMVIDAVGTDKAQCSLLARTAAAVLVAAAGTQVPEAGAVIQSAELGQGPMWLPDTQSNPPLARYMVRVTAYLTAQ